MVFGLVLALFGFVFTVFGAMFDTLRLQPELAQELGSVPESAGALVLGLGLVVLAWGTLEVLTTQAAGEKAAGRAAPAPVGGGSPQRTSSVALRRALRSSRLNRPNASTA
jgi:hypothetical protein